MMVDWRFVRRSVAAWFAAREHAGWAVPVVVAPYPARAEPSHEERRAAHDAKLAPARAALEKERVDDELDRIAAKNWLPAFEFERTKNGEYLIYQEEARPVGRDEAGRRIEIPLQYVEMIKVADRGTLGHVDSDFTWSGTWAEGQIDYWIPGRHAIIVVTTGAGHNFSIGVRRQMTDVLLAALIAAWRLHR